MDFCRKLSASDVLPSEYPQERVPSPACSDQGGFTDSSNDLFPCEKTEGDISLEWLSIFVEDCLSNTGNYIPPPSSLQNNSISKHSQKENPQNPSLQQLIIPGKARSKRKRTTKTIPKTTKSPLSSFSHIDPQNHLLHLTSSDPLLLNHGYWLAESELIVVKKERRDKKEEKKITSKDRFEGSLGQPRRCTHCLSQRTPQWRAGPLGPKTLCNACGVRFKSGRLLPEYRPAKSPTFVSYKHSNSHKKVLEMRMSILSSPSEY